MGIIHESRAASVAVRRDALRQAREEEYSPAAASRLRQSYEMSGQGYKISEISAAAGVPPATLRLWEQHGLIHPKRTASGYRVFEESDFARVREIVRLRTVHGLNLAAIRSALGADARPASSGSQPANGTSAIGPALRRQRMKCKMTVRALAASANVSPSVISTLERTSRGASFPLIKTLAGLLSTTVTDLISAPAAKPRSIVRAGTGRRLAMLGEGIRVQELASGPRLMDCQEWALQPGAESNGFYAHEGEEFIRVLEGCFEIEVDGMGVHRLEAGDSIYFESRRPHSWRSIGPGGCRLLWVNTPPSF